ncbi:MAG: N-acetyltransferase family protein [Candidatus Nanopelagicales bacterium]
MEPVRLRPATTHDAARIAEIYAPHVESSYASFEETAPDPFEIAGRMTVEPRLPWLVALDGETVLGFAYAAHHRVRRAYRWACDVSVYLDASATGRGVGSALYAELLPLLTGLGYVQCFAAIALPNDASVALHRAHGFAELGVYRDVGFKLGEWRSVAWFQRTLVDPPAEPSEPRAWQP